MMMDNVGGGDSAEWQTEAEAMGWIPPSRRARLVDGTPRLWQYYWVDFPHDSYPPEFVGEHPGVVVRAARHLTDTCIIVPITSTPQDAAKHIHELAKNPNPLSPTRRAWAVCDHLYTIHVARLRPCRGKYGNNVYPRIGEADRAGVAAAIRAAMPLLGG